MKLPRKIIIGGQVVKIKYVPNLKGDKGEDLWGESRYNQSEIVLCKGMDDSKKLYVFFHEYWHYVSDIYDLKLTEQQCSMYSTQTLNLIRGLKLI